MHIWLGASYGFEVSIQEFVKEYQIQDLNVAGSRASKDPKIYLRVYDLLENAFFLAENHSGMLGGPGEE